MPKSIIVKISILEKEFFDEEFREFFWKSINSNILVAPFNGDPSCETNPPISWFFNSYQRRGATPSVFCKRNLKAERRKE